MWVRVTYGVHWVKSFCPQKAPPLIPKHFVEVAFNPFIPSIPNPTLTNVLSHKCLAGLWCGYIIWGGWGMGDSGWDLG